MSCVKIKGVYISLGNDKMGQVPSVSLMPGPISQGGSCDECCKDFCYKECYAKNHCLRGAKHTYIANQKIAIESPTTIKEAVIEYLNRISSGRFFRWFVSGDIISPDFCETILDTCDTIFQVCHLMFSKRFSIIDRFMKRILNTINLSTILSGWRGMSIKKRFLNNFVFAWVDDGGDEYWLKKRPEGYHFFHCPGNCDLCGFCWRVRKKDCIDLIITKH